MRLLLAQPSWSETHGSYSKMAKRHGCVPPLGIGYLAAAARNAGHDVSILDAEAEFYSDAQAAEAVLEHNPEMLGLSATTPIFHKAANIAREVKARRPELPIIVGGPHISILAEEVLEDCFDAGMIGESDSVFVEFIENFMNGGDIESIPGVVFHKHGKKVNTGWCPIVHDLDSLPFPAWDLYNTEAYTTHVRGRGHVRYSTLTLTRGCPFNCVFCSASLLEGKKLRCRSPENVVSEMRHVKETLGIDHFSFNDSTLTIRRELIEELCRLLIKEDMGITWEGWTRANLIDRELMELMKEAGFVRISFGVESGSPRILKLIRKEVSHEAMRKAYKYAGELGIEATCSAMMGHPGETEADVWSTVRFIRSIPQIEYSPLSIAVPYPGTELYRMAKAEENGLKLLSEDYTKYLRYSGGVMEVNGMSPEYLRKLQKKALIFMHLTPSKIIGTLRRFGLAAVWRAIVGSS